MEEKIASQKLFAVTNEEKIPMMLTFMFGEAARVAQRGASERLMGWCQAYEGWLAERRDSLGRREYRSAPTSR